MDQKSLYDQFHLDEPWNSPHNIELVDSIPDVYRMPGATNGKALLHVFVGEKAPFDGELSPAIRDITDGTTNTIMAALGGSETATEWTRPGGLEFDPTDPLRVLGSKTYGGYPVIMFDGRAGVLSPDTTPGEAAVLITNNSNDSIRSEVIVHLLNYSDPNPPASMNDEAASPAELNLLTARKMKGISKAMWQMHDANRHFVLDPRGPGGVGEPTLSWRVTLLSLLGERELESQFHFDEPWDSPHNLTLLKHVPEFFRTPNTPEGKTRLHVFTGAGTPFSNERLNAVDIDDGNANTIMLVLGGPETAVEWTRPGGVPFNPADPFSVLGETTDGGYPVVMFDNVVRLLSPSAIPREISRMITHGDGQQIAGESLAEFWPVDQAPVFQPAQRVPRKTAAAMEFER